MKTDFLYFASIIIINYNGKGLTIEALKALEKQTFQNFEVIVVDNNSRDNSLNEIKNFLDISLLKKRATVIELSKNIGFAGGCNEGFKYAKGKYIVLLNNDAQPDKNWLNELVKAADRHPEVGICASKIIVYGTNKIDAAGHLFTWFLKGFKRGEEEIEDAYNKEEYVFGACGGAALYRREMIDEIGFFDENFFLIYEDVDIDFRAQLAGWKVLYIPSAVVYHKVHSTISCSNDLFAYYTLRNIELVRLKNVPITVFIVCFPFFILEQIAEVFYSFKLKKLKIYIKAKKDAIKMAKNILKTRKAIIHNKKISDYQLLAVMTPIWQKDLLNLVITKIKKILS